jgi:hypothetical protein
VGIGARGRTRMPLLSSSVAAVVRSSGLNLLTDGAKRAGPPPVGEDLAAHDRVGCRRAPESSTRCLARAYYENAASIATRSVPDGNGSSCPLRHLAGRLRNWLGVSSPSPQRIKVSGLRGNRRPFARPRALGKVRPKFQMAEVAVPRQMFREFCR